MDASELVERVQPFYQPVRTPRVDTLHPESLPQEIDEYRSRDISVFVRDVGLNHKLGTDIIQKEVIPNFVVYPVAGSRMMMWQELAGTSRHTRGRFFVPLVFNEKRDEALLALLSQYSWELQKTVAREIFYRFCPFAQEKRAEFEKALSGDLKHKYQNRQRKVLMKIESPIKRFEKENEPIPEDLLRHPELLKA